MRKRLRRLLPAFIVILLVIILTIAAGTGIYTGLTDMRKHDVDSVLQYYSETVLLKLQESLNEANTLAQTARSMQSGDVVWFENAAAYLFEREEVRAIYLFEGDTLVSVLPEDIDVGQIGQELRDFSYIYTLAKVVKELVVEGPVVLDGSDEGQEVFLFLQPFMDGDAYMGQVVVALDSDYVLQQLELDMLTMQGYDYELWRVDPQDGSKEVVVMSRPDINFSQAVKTNFYLPTEWNLSIQPSGGWVSTPQSVGIVISCCLLALLLLGLIYALYRLFSYSRTFKQLSLKDSKTGLYNKAGLLRVLEGWATKGEIPITLFYFVFEGYGQISQLMDSEEKAAFQRSIHGRLNEFVKCPFTAGRLGDGHFVLAAREDMDGEQAEDFARGVSLELLLKTRIDDKKIFLTARYHYMNCRLSKGSAENQITLLIRAYYNKRTAESPASMLTEKCRQLTEGRNDVSFDEYTDLDMMELSKAFNQYRKQVEQLAYYDQVFHVGNRQKYIRDANMLISYDKKRRFSLFCVDICAFSQYNQLFSADVGDEILHEVVQRLARQFGNYLYRINGDVFLGILLSGENEESLSNKLKELLEEPVSAGNTSFALQVKIAVCRYPETGTSPEALLDRIQCALRYAKQSGQKFVMYNAALDSIIQTENEILHRIESAIWKEELEIWYQPIFDIAAGRFTAVEALARLSDGKGGYFSAGQVIDLAERSSAVGQLGDYVLSRACRFMKEYGEKLGLLRMGVNLSVQQLLTDSSADHLLNLICASGVSPDKITLEVTESVLIQSIEQATMTLNKLRAAGIRIALDDFGVGYSSLNYLSNLPVDVIKIDRSLTWQIPTNPKQYALLHTIVEMAKVNSMTVIAEGIETAEEQEMIAAAGVQYIQGFYYARPMPGKELGDYFN